MLNNLKPSFFLPQIGTFDYKQYTPKHHSLIEEKKKSFNLLLYNSVPFLVPRHII